MNMMKKLWIVMVFSLFGSGLSVFSFAEPVEISYPYAAQTEAAKQYLAEIVQARRDKIDRQLDYYSPEESLSASSSSPATQADPEAYQSSPVQIQAPDTAQQTLSSPAYSTPQGNNESSSQLRITGNYQMGLGITGDDVYWKRSDYNLNETDWRMFSTEALNNRENTFDPAIFSFLRFDIDYPASDNSIGFHSKFDISPWSFIGTSERVRVSSAWGDTAEIQLKYWSNTGYTFGEVVKTQNIGNSFNLPQIKVEDDKAQGFTTAANWGDVFTIPELKIHREFWPLREMSFYYQGDGYDVDLFPAALEDKAYNSDDPLGLSNHRTYWEESQWLTSWVPGNYNNVPDDYFPGEWDDTLAFLARDAGNTRLTSLRGMSFNAQSDNALFDFVIASPQTLWQDYDSFDTLNSVSRLKLFASENLTLGGLYGFKFGFNENNLDAYNHIWGVDLAWGLSEATQILMEVATSRSEYDRESNFTRERRGNTYHVSLVNSSANEFGKDYFELYPQEQEQFYKLRLSATHMDEGFESALASHRFTRDDMFWGRHVTFRKPYQQFFAGLYEPAMDWYYVKQFRIGDGIDSGRDAVSLRYEIFNLFDAKLDTLFDIRNVHAADGEYIENVSRIESTYRASDKLTLKALGLYHDLPDTVTGVDPLLRTSDDVAYFNNNITGGEDPSLKTVSFGGEYWFLDWFGMNAIWEHSNDTVLAYDGSPRGLLTAVEPSLILDEEGKNYRTDRPILYSQQHFPAPPYSYFDIFKVGMKFHTSDTMNVYLDWTRNEYEWSQLIDDNSNHVGVEVEYLPIDTLGVYIRYVYSRVKDISELVEDGTVSKRHHHNFAWEARYRPEKDREFILQYGVGRGAYMGTSTSTPFGGDVPVLDTQHIVRLYYQQEF